MKKIMFLISSFNIGGTEKALINMLNVMDKNKYQVDVYVLENKGGFLNELPDWVNLKVINQYKDMASYIMDIPAKIVMHEIRNKKFVFAFKLGIAHLIFKLTDNRTYYYNVVLKRMDNIEEMYESAIAYSGPFDFITMYILKKVEANEKIQWIHFDVSKFYFNKKFAKFNYKYFDKIIAVSNGAAKELIKVLPNMRNKIEVVHNFLPSKICISKAEQFQPYSSYELKSKYIFLTVGRLTIEKGQFIIPDVVKKLLNKKINNFIWYIVGDGNQKNKILNEIVSSNLGTYIKMVGEVSNPYPYYKYANLYIQTSLHEGYCLTIAEAKLFNKYVITTDVIGAYDQIENENDGIITTYDSDKLANAIEKYITSNEL